MKMNSTTRAKSPLVALVVLSLLFVGLSAIAYPALSSEGGEPEREINQDGRNYALADDENSIVLIRGIGGYVFKDSKPVPGILITLLKQETQPAPTERPDPNVDGENDRLSGTRGETDRNTNRDPVRDPNRDYNRDTIRDTDRNTDRKTDNYYDQSMDGQYTDRDIKPTDKRILSNEEPVRNSDKLVTKTDRAGYFEFLGLDRGQYLLVVYHDGTAIHRQIIKYAGTGSSPFRIILGQDTRPDARLETETYLVKGKVMDERKQPIAGARVQLTRLVLLREKDQNRPYRDMDQRPGTDRKRDYNRDPIVDGQRGDERQYGAVRPQSRTTTTDRQGNFQFENVPGGAYVLTVEARGFYPHKEKLRVHENTRVPVQLKHFPVRERPTLQLKASVVAKDRDGLFNDVIFYAFSSQGKPLGRVQIYVDREYTGATDANGMLISHNYRPGTHTVWGLYKDHRATTSFTIRGSEPRPDPDPDPEPNREVGYLHGVVSTEGGYPIVGAEVMVRNDDNRRGAKTNEEGKFGFELLEGEYVIVIHAEGFEPFEDTIVIEANGRTMIEVVLKQL